VGIAKHVTPGFEPGDLPPVRQGLVSPDMLPNQVNFVPSKAARRNRPLLIGQGSCAPPLRFACRLKIRQPTVGQGNDFVRQPDWEDRGCQDGKRDDRIV
jgi:hypothetical protein